MSITVTATASGANSNNGIGLAVKVVTGALAAASQPGATAGSSTVTTPQLSITPGHAGSWVYGAVVNGGGATAYSSILANTTFSQNTTDATNNVAYGAFRSASGTTTSATTYGAGAPSESANLLYLALAEILASGTLAEDASSPAPVTAAGAKTVTTASFTPPGGSLLVAMATCNTNAGGNALTMAVTGGSLTWTRVAACPTSPYGTLATVWVADVPGGAVSGSGGLSAKKPALAGSGTASGGGGAVSGSGGLSAKKPALAGSGTTASGSGGSGGGGAVPVTAQQLHWPNIITEAGFTSTSAPVQPPGTFVLNDVSNGILGTDVLGGGPVWNDLSPWVRSGSVSRPATRQQGPLWSYAPGTAGIVLKNADGRFDPDNLSGPYVSGGATLLNAMTPVRQRAVWNGVTYPLFSGFADSWTDDGRNYAGRYAETTLSATDAQKVLAGTRVLPVGTQGAGEDTGARVTRILNAASWYTGTGYRTIAAGNSTLQGYTGGDYAWTLMQGAADSEIGELYIDGSGKVVFRNRRAVLTDTRSSVPQAVFGDAPGTVHAAGTELPYTSVTRARDDTTLANDIQATRTGGTLQEAQDAASIAKYLFPRSFSRSDLILQDDPTALLWAQWVLYVAKSDEDRFDQITVNPLRDPANLWPQVLGRQVGDRIQVWRRPPGVAPVVKDCFVRGIAHQWDWGAGTWQTTFTLQDASKYGSFLTLDNPTLGALNSNALAF